MGFRLWALGADAQRPMPHALHAPGILHVLDAQRTVSRVIDGDGVEAECVATAAVTLEPEARDPLDLAPLAPIDRHQRMPPPESCARLHLDERDEPAAARDQIDFPVTEAEITRDDAPAGRLEVARGVVLAAHAEEMGFAHAGAWLRGRGAGMPAAAGAAWA